MKKTLFASAAALIWMLCLTVPAAQAEWAPKCIPEPYAAFYEDDLRSLAVNRYEKNGCVYFVCDVQLENVSAFQAPYTTGEAQPLSELVQGTGAVLAINADDFGTHIYGTIIRSGQVLRTHDTTRHMLMVGADGSLAPTEREKIPTSWPSSCWRKKSGILLSLGRCWWKTGRFLLSPTPST